MTRIFRLQFQWPLGRHSQTAFLIGLFTAAFLFLSQSIFAQTVTGSITGIVTDPKRLGIPAASITVTNDATGFASSVQSEREGAFAVTGLLPGRYTVQVSFAGFKTLKKANVPLSAGERRSLGELPLELGALSEVVSVSSTETAVQTISAERSALISSVQVKDLMLIGRDYLDLLRTLPGVADFSSHESPAGFNFNVSIQGNRPGTNNLALDGITNLNSGGSTGTWLSPSVDSIAEIKTLTNNYQAEYGRNSGASVNVITKSGSRDFHGGGYYFKRNEGLNANDYFYNQRHQSRARYRYDFGGFNLGGPVYIPKVFNANREKLFFFVSREFLPQSFPNAQNLLTVPTQAERNGDFSQTHDQNGKLVTIRDPGTGLPFPGNVIPRDRINSDTQKLLNLFPLPNYSDGSRSTNYLTKDTYKQPRYETLFRVDYVINNSNLVYVRGIFDDQKQTAGYGVPAQGGNWGLIPSSYHVPSKGGVISLQQTLSPTLIHQVSFGATRAIEQVSPRSQSDLDRVSRNNLGIQFSQFNPDINDMDLIPNLTFGGVPNAANVAFESRYPFFGANNIFDFNDNVTKVLNKHILKAGIFVERVRRAAKRASVFNGAFDFSRDVNNPLDSNWAYSNALLGVYRSYTESTGRPWGNMRFYNIEWFGQDSWRVTRKLTLDFGIRFSIVQPQYERDGKAAAFAPDRYASENAGVLVRPVLREGKRAGLNPVTGQYVPALLIGSLASGDPANGMVTANADQAYPRALYDNRGVQFGPRFGFAYDVFGDSKMAIRGGFGISYNREDSSIVLPFTENPPLLYSPTSFYGTLDGYLSSGRAVFPSSVNGIDRAGYVPNVMSFSLGVQRDLGWGVTADISYAGTLGRHQRQSVNLNGIAPGANFRSENLDPTTGKALPPDFLRPYPGLGNINYVTYDATSNYHSLQTQLNRRFSRGLQFGGTWTWSKTMSTSDGSQVSRYLNERSRYYGLAGHDRTHIVSVNWIYDIPQLALLRNHAAARGILGGWQLAGILSLVSGAPLSVDFSTTGGVDITGSSTETARPDIIGNPILPKNERTPHHYFNTQAFALPSVGSLGNAAKYVLRGPGINNWDMALYKNIRFLERASLQFRIETYNTFNHTQYSGLDTSARFDAAGKQVNARFGQVISSRSPRRMQLALKLQF